MAVPEKAAKMATAAARQRLSPAITQQAKAICSGRAFGSSGVCVACGGGAGSAHRRRSRLSQILGGGAAGMRAI